MAVGKLKDGIVRDRLESQVYSDNFCDLHPLLSAHEARIASERCYFCYDAPCTTACPTEIDIPLFIRQISTDNPKGSALTIFSQNIFGGMCARVCPTETLCEEACVREEAEGKPVKIGQLQRYATDLAMANGHQFFERAEPTGKKIAVVGAGPAGIACAHRLSILGHSVSVYDARNKSGGLNEYGIAAYKTVDEFAQREISYILQIGGIDVIYGKTLGDDLQLDQLTKKFDAVFLGIGLGATGNLGLEGENANGVTDAIDFIEDLRQAEDYSNVAIGRRVVVIGGGMTAIDAAVQAKHLGAEEVTICYRRGQEQMAASRFEQELAASAGVNIRHWLNPAHIHEEDNQVTAIEFEYTVLESGKLVKTGQTTTIVADQIFRAIGQKLDGGLAGKSGLNVNANRIAIDENGRTSHEKVWAGGDCAQGGDDLTVSAVAMGRDAALDMHQKLSKGAV